MKMRTSEGEVYHPLGRISDKLAFCNFIMYFIWAQIINIYLEVRLWFAKTVLSIQNSTIDSILAIDPIEFLCFIISTAN